MCSSPEELSEALEEFRAYTVSVNCLTLEKLIPIIERTQAPNPNKGYTEANQRLRAELLVGDLLQNEPLDIENPSDVLERWDDFKHTVNSNTSIEPDKALQVARRNEFFLAVEAGPKEKSPQDIREIIADPSELRLLAELFDAIWGSGSPDWKCKFHGDFLDLSDCDIIDPYFVAYCGHCHAHGGLNALAVLSLW